MRERRREQILREKIRKGQDDPNNQGNMQYTKLMNKIILMDLNSDSLSSHAAEPKGENHGSDQPYKKPRLTKQEKKVGNCAFL